MLKSEVATYSGSYILHIFFFYISYSFLFKNLPFLTYIFLHFLLYSTLLNSTLLIISSLFPFLSIYLCTIIVFILAIKKKWIRYTPFPAFLIRIFTIQPHLLNLYKFMNIFLQTYFPQSCVFRYQNNQFSTIFIHSFHSNLPLTFSSSQFSILSFIF